MATIDGSQLVSRRNVVRGAAGLGLLAPALGASHAVGAQQGISDANNHPAVGVWVEGESGPTFTYDVFHADGTFAYYSPWLGNLGGNDPTLAVIGFGVWQPIAERTIEVSFQIAWMDATVANLVTFKARLTVNEVGTRISGPYKAKLADRLGRVTQSDAGVMSADRMQLEPFDDPETPEATPES